MVTVRLLVGAVLGLCATAGASPTYSTSDNTMPDASDALPSDASPVLDPAHASVAGAFLVQDDLDASFLSVNPSTLMLAADPREYRPAAYPMSSASSLNSLNNADAETISTLMNAPDNVRRGWFSEGAPSGSVSKVGLTNTSALADARGLLQAVPTIAVIPLPGALVSGVTTIGLIGLAYAAKRLRRRH